MPRKAYLLLPRALPVLVLLLLIAPAMAKKKATAAAPKVDLAKLTFHDCKGECTARKQVKKLKAFRAPKAGMSNPLGVNVCHEQLGGKFDTKKLPSKERGVCRFSDGSSVELFGLHGEAEKFILPN